MGLSKLNISGLARAAFGAVALLTLAACQAQSPSDLLFGPTRSTTYVPETYGTQYDCKVFRAAGNTSGWRGIVGGKKYDFDRTSNVSREACFQTRAECNAFLSLMSGYVDLAIYSRCQPI